MGKNERLLTFETNLNDIDILRDDEDMAIVSMDIMHTGLNRNNCDISEGCIKCSLPTIANKPITFRYNKQNANATDVVEHAHNKKEFFETRVAGHIPTGSRMRFVERENGKIYLNVEGVLQKRYVEPLLKIINENGGKMKVSVEMRAVGKQDKKDGIFHIDSFKLQCVTLLSNNVLEGMEGCHMELENIGEREVDSMNQCYFSFASSRNNIIEQIKTVKEERKKLHNLTTKQIEQRLWDRLKDFSYRDGTWTGHRYWIQDTDTENGFVFVHDNQTNKDFKIPYVIDEDGNAKLDFDGKVEVRQETEWKEKTYNTAFSFSAEEYGLGDEIKVDKTANAMSDDAWGDVDKIDLRNKVLEAKNYRDLIYDVYLDVQEGWEDAPSEHLKYPVMQIKEGTAVYNRNGLASALGYAEASNNAEVAEKVKEIYKGLGILETKEAKNSEGEDAEPDFEKLKKDYELLKDKYEDLEKCHERLVHEHEEAMACSQSLTEKADKLQKDYDDLNERFCNTVKELDKYHIADMIAAKKEYAVTYKRAFTDDEYEVIAAKASCADCDCEEFKRLVDEKITEKAKAQYYLKEEPGKEEREAAHSAVMFAFENITPKAKKAKNIDDVLASFGK